MVWTAYEYTADDCISAAGELLDESISRPDSGLEAVNRIDEEAVRKYPITAFFAGMCVAGSAVYCVFSKQYKKRIHIWRMRCEYQSDLFV